MAALNNQALDHRLANDRLFLLSIDLATFYDISSTTGLHLSPFGGLTSSHVFPTAAMAPHHPQPTTPKRALVVLTKNYLKWWAIQLTTH